MSTPTRDRRAPVDWDAARRRAATLARPGPSITREAAADLVASMRDAAVTATGPVGDVTGLHDAATAAAGYPVHVLDRGRWAAANVETFAELTGTRLPPSTVPGSARLAGEELGVVLALLSSRVLGQFDPFAPGPGRLLLVAPNIAHLQRELALQPRHFHLWVCLHEQTHAVQFAAAPWLAGHLRGILDSVTGSLTGADDLTDRMRSFLRALPRVLGSEHTEATSAGPLMDAVLGEEERRELAGLLSVMALLEGHADVVMDDVGPAVVPSVARIRQAFDARRGGRGLLDVALRRLLGLDAKLAQYRQGAAFVRAVVGRVGHAGLAAAFTGPELLPQPAEITDPGAWVRRVHG